MGTRKPDGGALPTLFVLGGAFLFGGAIGCLFAASVDGGGFDVLHTYLAGYLEAARSGQAATPGILALIWEQARWPLCAALLGLVPLGIWGLPILFSARGFFFAFSVGSFVRMFGPAGGLLSFSAFGLSGLFTIPVLFVLGVEGWTRLRGEPAAGGRALRYLLCGAVLILCMLVEYFLAPRLFAAAAELLSA